MAQTTILATGTDGTLSSEFTIAAGEKMKIGLFPATGNLDLNACAAVFKKTGVGSQAAVWGTLGNGAEARPVAWVSDPGTYYVQRAAFASAPAAFGVYTEPCGRNLF